MKAPTTVCLSNKERIKDDGSTLKITKMAWAGFNVKFIKKEENRQIRLASKAAAQSAIAAVVEDAAMEDAASTGKDVDGEERLADGADEGEHGLVEGDEHGSVGGEDQQERIPRE